MCVHIQTNLYLSDGFVALKVNAIRKKKKELTVHRRLAFGNRGESSM